MSQLLTLTSRSSLAVSASAQPAEIGLLEASPPVSGPTWTEFGSNGRRLDRYGLDRGLIVDRALAWWAHHDRSMP